MPRSILAAIDLAASTDQVVAAAKEYSKAFSAKLYLIHVTPEPEAMVSLPSSTAEGDYDESPVIIPLDRQAEADRLREEHRALQDLKTKVSDAGIDATALLIEGTTVEKILLEVDRLGIDLMIIGSHAPSFLRDLVFGSTTKDVLREAGYPVLVLPPQWDQQGPI